MSTKRLKQYSMLLLAVGVIAVSLSGGGTFASFNAQVANRNNTFKTGTLYLHETATNTCTSESSSSNANWNTGAGAHFGDACDILFTGVNATGYDQLGLDMKNAGTLDGDGLHLALGNTAAPYNFSQTGCASSVDWTQVGTVKATLGFDVTAGPDPVGPNTDAASGDTIDSITLTSALGISLYSGAQFQVVNGGSVETFTTTAIVTPTQTVIPVVPHLTTHALLHSNPVKYSPQFSGGGGNLCDDLYIEIVEVGSAASYGNVTFDADTALSTSSDPVSKCVLGTPSGTGCSAGVPLAGAGSLSNVPTFTNGDLTLVDLTNPQNTPWDNNIAPRDPNTGTGMDSGTHRYIDLILYIDPAADNSVQGLAATFDLVWNMNQSHL